MTNAALLERLYNKQHEDAQLIAELHAKIEVLEKKLQNCSCIDEDVVESVASPASTWLHHNAT